MVFAVNTGVNMDPELSKTLFSLQGRADFSLEELLDLATRLVPRVATGQARYKVTEVPSERTVRYYTTSGLIDTTAVRPSFGSALYCLYRARTRLT